MVTEKQEIVTLLRQIRNLLEPIAAQYDHDFKVSKLEKLNSLMSGQRKLIFPLLFDERHLSQDELAKEAGVSQPTVSRFINALLQNGIIRITKADNGENLYEDNYGLLKMLENKDD